MGCTFSTIGFVLLLIVTIAVVIYAFVAKKGSPFKWSPNQISSFYVFAMNKIGSGNCPNGAVNAANCLTEYAYSRWDYSDVLSCITGGQCNKYNDIISKLNNCFTDRNCPPIN